MKKIFDLFETALKKVCEGIAYLPILIFTIITYEVISRYCFNKPTSWAWVTTQHLFLVVCLFGGVYAFITKSHIRIEMLYDKFSSPLKLIANLITLVLFVLFAGVFVWKSGYMAQAAIAGKQISRGAFALPIYPFKALMPLVGFLFLIQGIISILKKK